MSALPPVLPPPPFDRLYDPDEIPISYYDDAAYQTRSQRDRAIADTQTIHMRPVTSGRRLRYKRS